MFICSISAAKNLFCCSTSAPPPPVALPLPLTLSAEAAEALLLLLPLPLRLRHSGVFCPLSLESLSDGFSRQGSLKRKLQQKEIPLEIYGTFQWLSTTSLTLDSCSDCCRCRRAHLWNSVRAQSQHRQSHSARWAAVASWRNPVPHHCCAWTCRSSGHTHWPGAEKVQGSDSSAAAVLRAVEQQQIIMATITITASYTHTHTHVRTLAALMLITHAL